MSDNSISPPNSRGPDTTTKGGLNQNPGHSEDQNVLQIDLDDHPVPAIHPVANPTNLPVHAVPALSGRDLLAAIHPWISELGFRYAGKPKGHLLGRLAMEYGSPLVRLLWGIKAKPLRTVTT